MTQWAARHLTGQLLVVAHLLIIVISQPVTLRTGNVQLGQLTFGTGVSTRLFFRKGPSIDISNLKGRNLFLMTYSDPAHAVALESALTMGGATTVSYVPSNTIMVAATAQVAAKISSELGAPAAVLEPDHKISPDWEPLLDSGGDTGGSGGSSSGDSSSGDGGSAPASSASTPQQMLQWVAASLVKGRAASLLSQLATLRGGTAAGGGAAAVALYGISIELLPGLTDDERREVEISWPPALSAALGRRTSGAESSNGVEVTRGSASDDPCSPALEPPNAATGSTVMAVFVCEADVPGAVQWLAGRSLVKWVAPLHARQPTNARASILLQTGQLDLSEYQDILAANRLDLWPYWKAGLMGQGEIVGVGDTGLDLKHCAFSDPRFNGTYEAALADPRVARMGIAKYAQVAQHRKVVQYAASGVAGDFTDSQGHGTLVAGSVAAAALSDPQNPYSDVRLDESTGAAPLARLSIVDGQGGNGRSGSILWLPFDAYGLYLPLHRQAGAYIISDSWGATTTSAYDSQSQSFDRFLWENPDFVSLLAAGNDGTKSLSRFTVSTPSVAKNVVSVGAGYREPLDSGSRSAYVVQGVRLNGKTLRIPIFPLENFMLPSLASVSLNLGDIIDGRFVEPPIPMAVALPLDACTRLRNPASEVRGTIVFATLGSCNTSQQAVNVAAAGALALVLISLTPGGAVRPDPSDGNGNYAIDMPVSMLDYDVGLTLVGFIYEGGRLNFSRNSAPINFNTITEYSGFGPLPDGRIKPDIIAPGVSIISTDTTARYTYDKCPNREYIGTSAATPLAAGTVALTRQYLRAGFYPTGSPQDPQSTPFTPSGMLLKALLIVGAQSLEGGWALNAGAFLGPAPDGYQGWGRPSLAASLPLANFTDPRARLQVLDRGEFTAAGQSVSVSGITATGTGPITAVLVYYDYPADPNALTALVNDLDLQLWVNNFGYLGNNPEDAADPGPDGANTVERVLLSAPPAGAAIRISVSAAFLPSLALDPATPQRWALAVAGHFEGSLESSLNPAWAKKAPAAPPPSPPRAPKPKRVIRKRKKSPPPPPPLAPSLRPKFGKKAPPAPPPPPPDAAHR